MAIGPVQLLVVGFSHGEFRGKIMAELDRLRESDTVRLIDLVFVRKDADGNVVKVQHSDLSQEEQEEFGAMAGALVGLGYAGEEGAEAGAVAGAEMADETHPLPDDIWYIEDVLPDDTAAAVALLEHRWAIGLRDAIRDAGGFHLADSWIHPLDLVAIGLLAAEEAEAQQVTQ
jgi:uncharacterized membrane protein